MGNLGYVRDIHYGSLLFSNRGFVFCRAWRCFSEEPLRVSQVRLRGRWHKYDCLDGGVVTSDGGVVTSSDTFVCGTLLLPTCSCI